MKVKLHIILYLIFSIAFSAKAQTNPNHVYVSGHFRNGTYVEPHYRTAPNSTNRDNFSTLGNTNPYTGQSGWILPDNKYYENNLSSANNNSVYPKANIKSYTNPISNTNNSSYNTINYDNNYTNTKISYVNNSFLNVRVAPSTDDYIKTKLYYSEKIEILKELSGDWLKIRYFQDNKIHEGYVSSIYVSNPEIGDFNSKLVSLNNVNENENEHKIIKKKAYFYEKPNESSIKTSYLVQGDKVKILKNGQNFIYTEYSNKNGNITKGWLNKNDINK